MVRFAGGRRERRRESTPSRACAFRVLQRTFGDGAYADKAFRAEAERLELDARDRALAQRLAYGAIQTRATLDYVVTVLSSRPAESIDLPLLNALRLGIYQLTSLDGVADHAAVDESVELAKVHGGGGHRFVNAVLRRAAREGAGLIAELTDDTAPEAAVRHSHPEWIVRLWWKELGREQTIALLERNNAPAENAVRANELLVTAGEVAERLAEEGVESRPAHDLPEGLVLDGRFDAHGSKLFRSGALMPQSRASMMVARKLAPEPGQSVLDLCAAPGAKTTHLAALMGGRGRLVAVERHAGRAAALAENCKRMGATCVTVARGDAGEPPEGEFDHVLLDPPCSDLGTLQSRPDVRWRKRPADVAALADGQRRLLDAAAERVRPGGTLVYSTCTISPRENDEQVEAFLARRPDFGRLEASRTLPHLDATDGFFIARMHREP